MGEQEWQGRVQGIQCCRQEGLQAYQWLDQGLPGSQEGTWYQGLLHHWWQDRARQGPLCQSQVPLRLSNLNTKPLHCGGSSLWSFMGGASSFHEPRLLHSEAVVYLCTALRRQPCFLDTA